LNSNPRATVQFFQPDSLPVTATELWFKVKVQVIQTYLEAFIANVSGKVEEIAVIDLFAGSGLFSVGHQREIFGSTGLTALSADLPVSQWIFCEANPEQHYALKTRMHKYFRNKPVSIFDLPPAELIDKLRSILPLRKERRTAVLCIVDPFSLEMPFKVLEKLASDGYSFLIPFTFMLNNRMDFQYYLKEHPEKLRNYLGASGSERLKDVESNLQFYRRLVRIYQNNMMMLGLNTSTSVHKLNSTLMELPAYYIGFYSRQFSTKAIQSDVRVSEHLQFELF